MCRQVLSLHSSLSCAPLYVYFVCHTHLICDVMQGLHPTWAAWYNTGLLIKLTPKGTVFSFLSRAAPHDHQAHLLLFSHDWPIVHGIPRWLPAYIHIPAESKALPHELGIGSCIQVQRVTTSWQHICKKALTLTGARS